MPLNDFGFSLIFRQSHILFDLPSEFFFVHFPVAFFPPDIGDIGNAGVHGFGVEAPGAGGDLWERLDLGLPLRGSIGMGCTLVTDVKIRRSHVGLWGVSGSGG